MKFYHSHSTTHLQRKERGKKKNPTKSQKPKNKILGPHGKIKLWKISGNLRVRECDIEKHGTKHQQKAKCVKMGRDVVGGKAERKINKKMLGSGHKLRGNCLFIGIWQTFRPLWCLKKSHELICLF